MVQVKTQYQTARRDALRTGAQRYQGPPCKYGHDGERYTASMNCVPCMRDAKRRQRARERQEAAQA